MKTALLDFYNSVLSQQTKGLYARNVTYKQQQYQLRAQHREYGFINWSIWHDNAQLVWTDQNSRLLAMADIVDKHSKRA
jgi:hypothetical protein